MYSVYLINALYVFYKQAILLDSLPPFSSLK